MFVSSPSIDFVCLFRRDHRFSVLFSPLFLCVTHLDPTLIIYILHFSYVLVDSISYQFDIQCGSAFVVSSVRRIISLMKLIETAGKALLELNLVSVFQFIVVILWCAIAFLFVL